MNDYVSGYGRLIHSNGDYYIGEFKKDQANGHGTYTHLSGTIYEGD